MASAHESFVNEKSEDKTSDGTTDNTCIMPSYGTDLFNDVDENTPLIPIQEEGNVRQFSMYLDKDKVGSFSKYLTFRTQNSNAVAKVDFQKAPMKKRKREEGEDILTLFAECFLRIVYSLSRCMEKNITVGLLNLTPTVILNHYGKVVLFTAEVWDSYIDQLGTIEYYLHNNVSGKKSRINISGSDIEVDNLKMRSVQYVRFKDLSKHDERVQLTTEEFYIMSSVAPAITRYLKQLLLNGPVIEEYLLETVHSNPDIQLLYGPIDASIYNRLPQEVNAYRHILRFMKLQNTRKTENIDQTLDAVLNENDVHKGKGAEEQGTESPCGVNTVRREEQ